MAQDEDKVIFLEEFDLQIQLWSKWSRNTPRKNLRTFRSKNYSVSGKISQKDLIFYKEINKPYNGKRYTEFFAEFLRLLAKRNMSNFFLIMDNLRMHKVCAIKQLIKYKEKSLHFLPSYLPQLNNLFFSTNYWNYCNNY